MSISVEQLAAQFEPLAVKEMIQLPPALPPPKPAAPKPVAPAAAAPGAAPVAAKPAAPAASPAAPVAKPAAAPAAPSVTGPAVAPAPVVASTPSAPAATPAASAAAPKPAVAPAVAAPKPAAPIVPPAPPPPPPKPIQIWKFEEKGIHLEVTIDPDKAVESARIMDRNGFAIDAVTGMDWLKQDLLEVIYDYLHFSSGLRVAIRARIPRKDPKIATISKVYPGADWHERETHDMFGIEFVGHRDLTPFLLPDDATYHPLLKDFQA